jgi:GNAT superfamily N-acetyltransferase
MSVEVRQIERSDIQGDDFDALLEVFRADIMVRDPEDPLPDREEVAAEIFCAAPDQPGVVLVARLDGQPAGVAWSQGESEPGDETQVSFIEILVKEELRRRGVASALLHRLVPTLLDLGQTSILAYPCAEIATEAATGLCAKLGLTVRQEERCSRVPVTDVDEGLMDAWIADAPRSAPGYRLEQWEGPCPDHLARPWFEAVSAMEDQPTDDLDLNLFTRGIDEQRTTDERRRVDGFEIFRSLALSPEGEAAGMSALFVHRSRPQVGHQGDTGVVAAHRGRRLGRWLKAANYRFVRSAHPELAVIETYNAQTNPWMLDINVAMGFRPHHRYIAHQGPIDQVAAALGL